MPPEATSTKESPPPQFKFAAYWVDRASFQEVQRSAVEEGEQQPPQLTTQIVLQVGAGINVHQRRGQVTLQAKVTPDPKWRPYVIDISVTGQFEAVAESATPEQFDTFCRVNVPTILFPYVRELVHRLTIDGRYGHVRIDPLNVQLALSNWQAVEAEPATKQDRK